MQNTAEIIIDNENKSDTANAEYIEQWYKENITKYIKTINEEGADKNNAYYKVAFIDGSRLSILIWAQATLQTEKAIFIFFTV